MHKGSHGRDIPFFGLGSSRRAVSSTGGTGVGSTADGSGREGPAVSMNGPFPVPTAAEVLQRTTSQVATRETRSEKPDLTFQDTGSRRRGVVMPPQPIHPDACSINERLVHCGATHFGVQDLQSLFSTECRGPPRPREDAMGPGCAARCPSSGCATFRAGSPGLAGECRASPCWCGPEGGVRMRGSGWLGFERPGSAPPERTRPIPCQAPSPPESAAGIYT